MTTVHQRNARNRRAGQEWERDLRTGFREEGFDIEALRLVGTEDEGDMVIRSSGFSVADRPEIERIIIEAKNAKWEPGVFVKEAIQEANNYAVHRGYPRQNVLALSIVKRRNKGWKDAYVVTTVAELLGLE